MRHPPLFKKTPLSIVPVLLSIMCFTMAFLYLRDNAALEKYDATVLLSTAASRVSALESSSSGSTKADSDAIEDMLAKANKLEPGNYLTLPLEVRLASLQHAPISSIMDDIRARLPLGYHELEIQQFVGPYLIAHWRELPEDIRQMTLTVVQSGLRQQPTRRTLLTAMREYENVAPFLAVSPNRKTSEKLREIASELESQ